MKILRRYKFVGLMILAVILITLTGAQIIHFTIWGDEGYSVLLANMPVKELIMETAGDVHPPLYYLILKLFVDIFGTHEWILQAVSMIPYILLIFWAIFPLRKEFGYFTAAIFIIFQSLTYMAMTYNIEVRMYSWAEFFVMICLYSAYKILRGKGMRAWVIFVISGIGAAYTHYYALISVAIVYLVLYIVLIIRNKKNIKACLISGCITSCAYLPWLFVLLSTLKRIENSYWISEIPTVWQCFFEIAGGKVGMVLVILFWCTSIIFLVKSIKGHCFSDVSVMILICILTLSGTMAVGIIVSHLIRPVFIARYLYPCAGLMWLAAAICIPKVIKKEGLVLLITCFFLFNGIRSYTKNFSAFYEEKKETDIFLNYLSNTLGEDGVVLAPAGGHLMWTVLSYYLPDTKHIALEDINAWENLKVPVYILLDTSGGNIPVDIKEEFVKKGINIEYIMDGRISQYAFQVYKVIK